MISANRTGAKPCARANGQVLSSILRAEVGKLKLLFDEEPAL